jgi:hypothetical protein
MSHNLKTREKLGERIIELSQMILFQYVMNINEIELIDEKDYDF